MRSNNEIIALLSELKQQQNLSISEIARRVGMAKSAVSRYFNKTREFPLNRAEAFAKAFGISQEYLLGLGEEQNPETINPDEVITTVFNQLDDLRKKKVVKYANEQLEEQNLTLPFQPKEEIDTLAAHSKNPNKEYTPEEIDGIKAYLDELSEEYDRKHR